MKRMVPILAVLVLTSLAGSCASPRSQPVATPPARPRVERDIPVEREEVVEGLVDAHNARRAKAGLSSLVLNPQLEAAAQEHARDMAERRKMSHRGGDGSSPFDRMTRQGYRFQGAAENVAYGFEDVESVMDGWMKSPGHRRNILGSFSQIGVGRAIARDGTSYWCVTFGTPSTR